MIYEVHLFMFFLLGEGWGGVSTFLGCMLDLFLEEPTWHNSPHHRDRWKRFPLEPIAKPPLGGMEAHGNTPQWLLLHSKSNQHMTSIISLIDGRFKQTLSELKSPNALFWTFKSFICSGKYGTTLGGGFKYFWCSTLLGEDEPILTHIFPKGLVQPPTRTHVSVWQHNDRRHQIPPCWARWWILESFETSSNYQRRKLPCWIPKIWSWTRPKFVVENAGRSLLPKNKSAWSPKWSLIFSGRRFLVSMANCWIMCAVLYWFK